MSQSRIALRSIRGSRMGCADDPMAVVDTQGRVKGMQGLRVVDASIFPVVQCANTPVLLAAEKIVDAMM